MILQIFSLPFLAGIVSAINLKVSSTGGNASSPLMYGLMFEDINHSGDGGIYAELINNRAFQGSRAFPSTLEPWVPVGNAVFTLQNTSIPLSSALPTSINVAPGPLSSHAKIGLLNPGWWGIDVKPQKYTGSFWALGSYKGDFTVKLQSNLTDDVFASVAIPSSCQLSKWVEHKFELEPNLAASNSNNTFIIEFEPGGGAVNFNLISLFPPTYKNRPNGNRPELMEALKALNPSFLRMPGGNNMSVLLNTNYSSNTNFLSERETSGTTPGGGTRRLVLSPNVPAVRVHGVMATPTDWVLSNISTYIFLSITHYPPFIPFTNNVPVVH
jgi:alpha-N-arabinofuranosidase